MPDIIQRLDKILTNYFGDGEISEFRKLLTEPVSDKGISASKVSIRKQLEPHLSVSEKYQSRIDIIISFSKSKLSKNKFISMLLNIGEASISLGELSSASKLFLYILSEIKDDSSLQNLIAPTYLSLADIYSRQADWKNSIKHIKLAQKIYVKYKDHKGIAKCENLIGTIEGDKGNLKKAKVHFEKSVSYLDSKKDSTLTGMLEMNLGILNNIQGNYELALTYYKRALIRFEQLEDTRRVAEGRHNLGMLYTQMLDYQAALAEFDKSIALAVSSGYTPTLGLSYLSKAYIYTLLHDYLLADGFADKAMEVCNRLNDRLSIADIYKIKGIIERSQQNYKTAENYFHSSLRINQELENTLNEAETFYELGILYKETNEQHEAEKALVSALKYYKKTGVADMIKRIEALLWNLN